MATRTQNTIPAYDLPRGDDLDLPFRFVALNRSQHSYDFTAPHRHNYYEVFFFEHGGGEHDIDFTTFPIRDNSLHFVTPGQVHQVRRLPGSGGGVLLFTTDFYSLNLYNRDLLQALPFLTGSHPQPVLNMAHEESMEAMLLIGMIREEFRLAATHREEVIRSYLNILLLKSQRLFEQRSDIAAATPTATKQLLRSLRLLVDAHFHAVHSAGAYARMLNVTLNHLNNITKELTGRTVSELIQERILLEAKRLLAHSSLSVKEIAYHLGFDDPSYFTRFFRLRQQLTPAEFRSGFE